MTELTADTLTRAAREWLGLEMSPEHLERTLLLLEALLREMEPLDSLDCAGIDPNMGMAHGI